MIVRNILKTKGAHVETVEPSAKIADVARIMRQKAIGAVIVLGRDERLLGVFSERDIVRGICEYGAAVLDKPVEALMTTEVISCGLDDTLDDLMERMTNRRIRHLPVIDKGKLAGLVSIGDVVKCLISETEMEAQALKQYIVTG